MRATIAPHLMTDRQPRSAPKGIRWRLLFQRGVRRDNGLVEQGVVSENERGHRLHHRYRARQHAGVVTARGPGWSSPRGPRSPSFAHDGGRWFEGHTEVDPLAVGDAGVDATPSVDGRG